MNIFDGSVPVGAR